MAEDIFIEAGKFVAGLYQGFLSNILSNIIASFITIIFLKLIFEIIFSLFPFIRRIVQFIFYPFVVFHQWTHLHKAKQINQKAIQKRLGVMEKEDIPLQERILNSKIIVRPTFSMGIGDRENTGIIILPTEEMTLKETMGLIYAPSKYGTLLSLIAMAMVPLIVANQIFSLIHLYILLGTILFLFPSQEDYRFIINTLLTNSTVSPFYFVYGIIVFLITTFTQIEFYQNVGFPLYWYIDVLKLALTATVIYYVSLLAILGFTGPDESLKTQRNIITLNKQIKDIKMVRQEKMMSATELQAQQTLLTILSDEEHLI
ncbi:MAG: hypothetical protein ACFFD1_10220 [Candidatus Thorarchaeota archaeon]